MARGRKPAGDEEREERGRRARFMREVAGMTQAQVVVAMGLDPKQRSIMSKLETGADLGTGNATVERLATAYGITEREVMRYFSRRMTDDEMRTLIENARNRTGPAADVEGMGVALVPSIDTIRRAFPELAQCLAYYRHVQPPKWSAPTIAVAAAGYWPDDVPAHLWEGRLDRLEAVLRKEAANIVGPGLPDLPLPGARS